MEIRIGIQHSPREIVIETDDAEQDHTALLETLTTAVAEGTPVTLRDVKGRSVLIPGAKVAYAEISTEEPRRVGFLG
ncbi:DUF3107 domain-containing protein [Brachybacterium muris]|uniref:DUF3107 domain-containing protein n=1 Tax=Brachybacterium muris TaxID=219301 RepID=UPI0021A6ECE1|nr:DUF3107 domain-containing protein [Brachybacterium muris]MCT1431298.1 DUF3107 domain-containing protein [Brachybacterium muris]